MIKTVRKSRKMEAIAQIMDDIEVVPSEPKRPDDRLTSKQVSIEFNIPDSTLRSWRRCRSYDPRYPRFHKLFTGKVYYVRAEIAEDLENMEVDTDLPMRWR